MILQSGELKRNPDKQLKRTGFAPRTKGIANRSKKAKAKLIAVAEAYEDSRGIAFDDVRGILGEDPSSWPAIKRPRYRQVCWQFHEIHSTCWHSGDSWPEAHHLAAGYLRGKSDELCALVSLSREWHEKVNTEELPLGRILWLKWRHDRPSTDWVRLTLLFGYHLPDLIPG